MIKSVAIIGAGQMGTGIAQVFAAAGYKVQLVDMSADQLIKAQNTIHQSLDRQVNKGTFTETKKIEVFERLSFCETVSQWNALDLVIEAIAEDKTLKHRLFQDLDAQLPPRTLLASNTSSLSITDLANATNRPDRVIGLHFMNPAPIMPLVEVIPGEKTSPETITTVRELVGCLHKTPVVSKDAPGFIVNRILMPLINEAIYALQDGIATEEDIDTAMTLGTHQPMGPLALADFIGLDTCLAIMKVLHTGFADNKYHPCPLLEDYVRKGRLGKKSGQGFYVY